MSQLVYQATLPDGSVYIGRTARTLAARQADHERDAQQGSHAPLHIAMSNGLAVTWTVLWEGTHWAQCRGKEIAAILDAKRRGLVVLNRTRGGFYDPYDAGVRIPKRRLSVATQRPVLP